MSISALRNQNSLDKLLQQVQKDDKPNTEKKSYVDERLWKPQVDKAGNGYAVLRFLPAPEGEELPWVRVWNHAFQGPTGQWFIENSLTTLNQKDPISEYNSQLWNSGVESDKEIARKQKRKLSYYANIYVVEDTMNPENNGKVMLYKFGKKIFDKLMEAMQPEFPDESPINPFDFWEGANFKLKCRNGDGGYRTYEPSSFEETSTLSGDDEALEKVWQSQHSHKEIVEPKNFKSYSELKAKLYKVLALDGSQHAPTTTAEDDDAAMDFTPKFKERTAPTQSEAPSPTYDEALPSTGSTDDDDDLDFFKSLADD